MNTFRGGEADYPPQRDLDHIWRIEQLVDVLQNAAQTVLEKWAGIVYSSLEAFPRKHAFTMIGVNTSKYISLCCFVISDLSTLLPPLLMLALLQPPFSRASRVSPGNF